MPLSGVTTHLHVAPFLIVGSEGVLLYDTGTPIQWSQVEGRLDAMLGDRPVDFIVPSHPEIAHCGNVVRLLEKYPAAKLAGDVRDYPLYFPSYADRLVEFAIGDEIDLGSHRFVFLDAIVKDLPSTVWGYERSTGVLFVADGFAYSHQPPLEGDDRPTHLEGECNLFASELGTPPADDQILWITKAALYWTHFVKFDLLLDRFQTLLETYPPKLVAPAHGAVIDDIDNVLWMIWNSLGKAYDPLAGVARAGVDVHKAG
ncbi:MBL fold metallo-hydrolase [Nocardioides humi]|nr:MBL fold metallo-hydrolase [Nocardioides humi]